LKKVTEVVNSIVYICDVCGFKSKHERDIYHCEVKHKRNKVPWLKLPDCTDCKYSTNWESDHDVRTGFCETYQIHVYPGKRCESFSVRRRCFGNQGPVPPTEIPGGPICNPLTGYY